MQLTISCVDPVTYGQRFLNFLTSVMRGGNPALRPAGLEESIECEQRPVGEREQTEAGATTNAGVSANGMDTGGGEKAAGNAEGFLGLNIENHGGPQSIGGNRNEDGVQQQHHHHHHVGLDNLHRGGTGNSHSAGNGYANGLLEDVIPGVGGGPNAAPGQSEKSVPSVVEVDTRQ